jgi:hypothetical protein
MRNRRCAAISLSLLLAAAAVAPASAQSIFAVNFLGESQFIGSARYRALGLSAYAALDSVNALSANPATMADLTRLSFSMAEIISLSNLHSTDATAYENRFQIPSVMLGVPLRAGLVFGIGYRTRFEGKNVLSYERSVEGLPVSFEVYDHRSGLFAVPFSLAWKAASWARVAGAFQLERGSIEDKAAITYYADNYSDAESKRMRSYSGTSWSASALIQVNPRLSVGAGVNSSIDYDVDETFAYTLASLDSSSAWDFQLPASWEIGASMGITDRWWLSAHYWQRGAPEADGYPQLAGSIGDERLISLGAERQRMQSGGFFARIPLRIGYYEDQWHLEYPEGRPVKSRFITFGSGFGLPGGSGVIDVSFEFGKIGSVSVNGVDERVFRVALGLSASEAWSRRKEER